MERSVIYEHVVLLHSNGACSVNKVYIFKKYIHTYTHVCMYVRVYEQKEGNEHTIQIFTDGSKNEHDVGSGTAIYIQNKLIHQTKHKLHNVQIIKQSKWK